MAATPGSGRPTTSCGTGPTLERARARGRARRLRRERPQRRLGVVALAGRPRHDRPPARADRRPRPARGAARHRRRGRPGRRGGGTRRGSSPRAARSSWRGRPAQEARARAEVAHGATWDDGTVWLDAAASRERLDVAGARGATFTPHCARIHPRRLVDGLAATVRRLGGAGRRGRPGGAGRRRCRRARGRPPGHRRRGRRWPPRAGPARCPGTPGGRARSTRSWSPPSRSPTSSGAGSGSSGREVFADHGHVVIYGQRTDDGRHRVRRARRPVPLGLGDPARVRRGGSGSSTPCARTLLDLLPQLARHPLHPRLGRPARHRPRLAPVGDLGPGDPHRAAPAATSGTESPRPTSPGAPSPTSCSTGARRSRSCPGSGTARRAGSPSRCAGSASTPGSGLARLADREESATGRPARLGAAARRGSPPTELAGASAGPARVGSRTCARSRACPTSTWSCPTGVPCAACACRTSTSAATRSSSSPAATSRAWWSSADG